MSPERITVSDLMTTALITMTEQDTVGHAELDMELASIRHIPVVDDRSHLVGILSNRDLARALGRGGTATVRIGDIVTRRVHTVVETTMAHRAAAMLLEHKIGALPVVGDDGQLVGLVTETDFLRVAHRALRGRPLAAE